jgi:hypothetical protein|tara:strand:+ start:212 stop:775 length:564 start_codon:yes stop_codon:yes gene_type:complete
MKKFKDLFEEIAADMKPAKGDKKPPKYLKPVSKGEQEFADKHVVDKKDYPLGNDEIYTGDRKGPKEDPNHVGGKDHKKGEPILKTYKSMTGGKSSKRSADKSQGDMKAVMQGSSKVAEEVEYFDEAFKAGSIKLKSGEMVKIDEVSAKALNAAIGQLSGANKKRMETEAMKDKSSLMGMVKFAKSAM